MTLTGIEREVCDPVREERREEGMLMMRMTQTAVDDDVIAWLAGRCMF